MKEGIGYLFIHIKSNRDKSKKLETISGGKIFRSMSQNKSI